MRSLVFLLPLSLLASPMQAQELTFDFSAPSENGDASFDEVAPYEPASNFELSLVAGYTYSEIAGMTGENLALQLNVADQYNLGALGFLDWAGNILFDDIGGATDPSFNLHRLHLQNSSGDISWKLGKYRIGWGEVEGAPVLDVINSALSIDSVGLDSDELPGQWFLGADYFASFGTVSTFVGIAPEVEHGFFTPAATSDDYEIGLQTRFPISGGEVSLYGARLIPQAGEVDLGTSISHAAPYSLVGVSGNYTIGNVMLELDLAGKFGLQRSTLTNLVSDNRVDLALGFEYAATNTMQVTGAITGQYYMDASQPYYVPVGIGIMEFPQAGGSYMLGVTESLMNSKLSLGGNAIGSLDGSMNIYALSANYSVSDALKLSASAMMISADPTSIMMMSDGYRQVGFSARFYY